ncbi:MAG: OmpA family protein, partial [Flavobacteriaceae bacterium]|nr:OmpA family protein [Flavobacteriaceae bacterium]
MIGRSQSDSNWISIADMMTALMIIFMFIAVNYIVQIVEYKFIEEDIYNSLQAEFEKEIENENIELGPDGTIRFKTGSSNLFENNQYRLTSEFENVLQDFIPRYWGIINSDKYLDYIKEIRIEGHSDTQPPNNGEDSYLYNLKLSSRRANAVLAFLREQPSYKDVSSEEKERMDFLFTSIGFS